MKRITILLPVLLLGATAWAQSSDPRDQVVDMATITVAHELCRFDLSEAEEDTIAKRRQALIDEGAVTAADIGAIEAELTDSMRRQISEGLCKPGGAEAKLYRQKLKDIGGE